MVKVEMKFNPYMMEYRFIFNGNVPRINSQVEKYVAAPLSAWACRVPEILYNEMNGYDFELEFIGTKLDYDEIVGAFAAENVREPEVVFDLKKEIISRKEIVAKIAELRKWLAENQGRYNGLEDSDNDLLDEDCTVIVVGDRDLGQYSFEGIKISLEYISDSVEFENVDLTDIPIVVDCASMSFDKMMDIITSILKRHDVKQRQIFFLMNDINKETIRVLEDIGVKNPNIIKQIDDNLFWKYIEFYPITSYIRKYIDIMRAKVERLRTEFEEEMKTGDLQNEVNQIDMDDIDKQIELVKEGLKNIEEYKSQKIENITSDFSSWQKIYSELLEKVLEWKSMKLRIVGFDEGAKMAENYNNYFQQNYDEFYKQFDWLYFVYKKSISDEGRRIFREATPDMIEDDYSEIDDQKFEKKEIPDISAELLVLKDKTYEKPKEGIIGTFISGITDTLEEPDIVVEYNCRVWRQTVEKKVSGVITEEYIKRMKALEDHKDNMTSFYESRLNEILSELKEKQEGISSQMTDDQNARRAEISWLTDFDGKLREIEGR
ncbi:hypothetical protein [Eubacterium xylanophilum]|uniref:hypothetical protein n=1 Tax=Eubacterium xylanophilum TaxID=39497 RepID=UPI0004799BF0|nr:hypothetical protein [Eubacterium xylanophilum]